MSDRIRTQVDAEPIAAALDILPPTVRQRLDHVRWYCGVDPVFTGLHKWDACSYGRSYRNTAHCCWPSHLQARPRGERVATVVVPTPQEPKILIHELGHALEEAVAFDRPEIKPVTWYAAVDEHEAFAEAFAAWLCPVEYADAQDDLLSQAEVIAFFEGL